MKVISLMLVICCRNSVFRHDCYYYIDYHNKEEYLEEMTRDSPNRLHL